MNACKMLNFHTFWTLQMDKYSSTGYTWCVFRHFYKEDNIWNFLFNFLHINPLRKKGPLPRGTNSFISRKVAKQFWQLPVLKVNVSTTITRNFINSLNRIWVIIASSLLRVAAGRRPVRASSMVHVSPSNQTRNKHFVCTLSGSQLMWQIYLYLSGPTGEIWYQNPVPKF